MLKSNTKKAREAVRLFIIENTNEEANASTIQEASRYIFNRFTSEVFSTDQERRYFHHSEATAFDYWLRGLPSAFHSCTYLLNSAVDILGDILEQTEQERNRYTEDQAEKMLNYLIYSEVKKGIKTKWN